MTSELELEFELLWDDLYPEIDLYPQKRILKEINPETGKPYGFRFDYVSLNSRVCIEINGKIWRKGGHNTGSGLLRDYTKLNLAIAEGWVTFVLADEMINSYWLDKIVKTIRERL